MALQLAFYFSATLFAGGLFLALSRRNAIAALMGIELMLNAALLNFAFLGQVSARMVDGQVLALFIMLVAAAQAAIGLALVLRLQRSGRSIELPGLDSLKG